VKNFFPSYIFPDAENFWLNRHGGAGKIGISESDDVSFFGLYVFWQCGIAELKYGPIWPAERGGKRMLEARRGVRRGK
jgi:hypothetical protein